MNYISAEEFKKQSEKVQKNLLDWWQPNVGDLIGARIEIINSSWVTVTKYKVNCINEDDIFNYDSKEKLLNGFKTLGEHNYSDEVIPLFTETQLRKFIEEKTKLLLEIQNFGKGGYCIHLNNIEWVEKQYNNLGNDLLQAYWQVAIKIAEELYNEEYK